MVTFLITLAFMWYYGFRGHPRVTDMASLGIEANIPNPLFATVVVGWFLATVIAMSMREHIGVQPVMDAVARYLPSPLDRPPVAGPNPNNKNKEEKRSPDPEAPFAGLVFKIVADTHGDLYYLRVYSGTLKAPTRSRARCRRAGARAPEGRPVKALMRWLRARWAVVLLTAGALFALVGSNLAGTTVTINGAPITVTQQTSTSVVGTTPPGVPGPAVILVRNVVGCQTTRPYTYL